MKEHDRDGEETPFDVITKDLERHINNQGSREDMHLEFYYCDDVLVTAYSYLITRIGVLLCYTMHGHKNQCPCGAVGCCKRETWNLNCRSFLFAVYSGSNFMSYLEEYYKNYDEDARLERKNGQVEFLTTMRYIEKHLLQKPDAYVVEIGARTGRYSRAIADMGFCVEAVELVPHNIEVFKKLITPAQSIRVAQGNVLDLTMYENDTFDITLMLGPMYHLYNDVYKHKAISESLRITKQGGIVFVTYCISDASILYDAFVNNLQWTSGYMGKGQVDPITFDTKSLPEDIFEIVRKDEIDRLMASFPVKRLHYVATDMISRFLRESLANMNDNTFDLYLRFHYAVCERPDMVGLTHHSLDIFKKL